MKQSWWRRFQNSHAHTQANIVCTFIIMLATIAYAIIAGRQLIAMKQQIAIMSGTLAEAKRSGEQSTSQMWSAIGNVNWMARSMDWSQKEAQQSLESSEQQSKTVLDATVANFRQEQRAWVGLGHYEIVNFDNKRAFNLTLPWVNSGKTPAIRTKVAVAFSFRPSQMTGPPAGHKYIFENAVAIAPQGTFSANIVNSVVTKHFDTIANGTVWMHVYGQFRYCDVNSGRIHTTSFCLYYSTKSKKMAFCEHGNDMD